MSDTCIDASWLARHPEVLKWKEGRPVSHPLDRAHPYPPGSGPRGQTCGSCAKLCHREWQKNYYKCRVVAKHWTRGYGTDVRLKDPACLSWEPGGEKMGLISTRLPAANP